MKKGISTVNWAKICSPFDISKLVNDKRILHMASPKGYNIPSHILYVDDVFIFCRADNKSLKFKYFS